MKNFIFVFCILFAIPLSAFEIKEISINGQKRTLRWNPANGPVRITLNSKGSKDLAISDTENAVRGALNLWQAVPQQTLTFQYIGMSDQAVENDTDGINSILWVENGWKLSSSVLGITKYSYFLDDPPELFDVDILLNGEDRRWSLGNQQGTVNPQLVLMHEVGHLLGFSHTSVLGAVLYPFLASDVRLTLSKDDRAGMKFLYGAPVVTFQSVSPIQGAVFPQQMNDGGLPLPIFRWGANGQSDYSVEFSDDKSFSDKKTVAVGQSTTYSLTPAMASKLEALSPAKNVFWRITSGTTSTHPRIFRFRDPKTRGISEISAVFMSDESNQVWKKTALLFLAGLTISALLIAWRRYRAGYAKKRLLI